MLRAGSKRKVAHCTNDATAYISNSNAGISLFCFRCGEKLFEPHGERSIAEILATRAVADDDINRAWGMPNDATELSNAPEAAIVWLLQGGLLPEKAEHVWGMRWHDKTQRVLIPVLGITGAMMGLLGRALDGQKPKYKAYQGTSSLFYATYHNADAVIVVEDILSAIAVHSAGYSAIAALGTSISPVDAGAISAVSDRVVGWFDPDPAGVNAWPKFRKRMGTHPVRVSRITSGVDPKRLPRSAIREKINEALRSK